LASADGIKHPLSHISILGTVSSITTEVIQQDLGSALAKHVGLETVTGVTFGALLLSWNKSNRRSSKSSKVVPRPFATTMMRTRWIGSTLHLSGTKSR
jgi:hypothetical protein